MSVDQGQHEQIADVVGTAEILAIAEEVWSALIAEDEVLIPLAEDLPADAVSAWVTVHGPWEGAVVVSCSPASALDLTRAVLRAEEDEVFSPEDVEDALGEIANVLGGNIKSLLPDPSRLGLPRTGPVADAPSGAVVSQADVLWRGLPVSVVVRSAAGAASPFPPHHEEPS